VRTSSVAYSKPHVAKTEKLYKISISNDKRVPKSCKSDFFHYGFYGCVSLCRPIMLSSVLTGWVIWPVKTVTDMTYNVFGGTLNLALSIYTSLHIIFLPAPVCCSWTTHQTSAIIISATLGFMQWC